MRLARLTFTGVIFHLFIGSAFAEQKVQKTFSIQLFEPAIGTRDLFFSVEGGSVSDDLAFGLGLTFNYQHRPLMLFKRVVQGTSGQGFDIGEATQIDVVKSQITANLVGALGLHFKWLHAQIGFDLPVNLMLKGNEIDSQGEIGSPLTGAQGLGDLRIQLKLELLRAWHGLSIALSPIFTVPTTTADSFGGDPFFTVRPRVALDYKIGDFIMAANAGWLFREDTLFFSSDISDRLLYGAALGYRFHRNVFVMAEVFGQAGFSTQSGCQRDPITGDTDCTGTSTLDLDAFPLELDVGGQFNIGRGVDILVGAGFGLVKAIGSPGFRILTGIRWSPDFQDTDGDGVYDYEDRCPTQIEDRDDFQDKDGCPDPDNDGDLIPDLRDKCPNGAEDKDGFEDEDGCPDTDNDGDGISDLKDECPFKKETVNGYKDYDGCPDEPDRDEDGVSDSKDKCPLDKEDIDEFQDDDGCPDLDNDKDGVPDSLDSCPNKPEDPDKFQDDDGCPDLDNDTDGVPDTKDKCPTKPETINGFQDEDGCPDKGEVHVIIKEKEKKIIITKKIFFATQLAKIKPLSYGILDEVALTLNANPQIKGIRIEGHTDSQGNANFNKKLSQKRAEAVRNYLVKQGVEPGRLFAVGYGSEKPIDSNRTDAGRAANRRVEFIILEQAPGDE